jgi:hypothetical protein
MNIMLPVGEQSTAEVKELVFLLLFHGREIRLQSPLRSNLILMIQKQIKNNLKPPTHVNKLAINPSICICQQKSILK